MINANHIIGGAVGTGLGYWATKSWLPALGLGAAGVAAGEYLPRLFNKTQLDKAIQKSTQKDNTGGGSEVEPPKIPDYLDPTRATNYPPKDPWWLSAINSLDPNYELKDSTFRDHPVKDTINAVENIIPSMYKYTMFLPEKFKGILSPTKLLPSGETIEKMMNALNPPKWATRD